MASPIASLTSMRSGGLPPPSTTGSPVADIVTVVCRPSTEILRHLTGDHSTYGVQHLVGTNVADNVSDKQGTTVPPRRSTPLLLSGPSGPASDPLSKAAATVRSSMDVRRASNSNGGMLHNSVRLQQVPGLGPASNSGRPVLLRRGLSTGWWATAAESVRRLKGSQREEGMISE
jgi:hypothetical protein